VDKKLCKKDHPTCDDAEYHYYPYPCLNNMGVNCNNPDCYSDQSNHYQIWNISGECLDGKDCDNHLCELHVDEKGQPINFQPNDYFHYFGRNPQVENLDPINNSSNHNIIKMPTHVIIPDKKFHKSIKINIKYKKIYPELNITSGDCDICLSGNKIIIIVKCATKHKIIRLCQYCYWNRQKCGWCEGHIDFPIYKCISCDAFYKTGIFVPNNIINKYQHNGCVCLKQICPHCGEKHKNHESCLEEEQRLIKNMVDNISLE
jgi:hypothetical protein